jgi:Ca-activated chloride channel family protein
VEGAGVSRRWLGVIVAAAGLLASACVSVNTSSNSSTGSGGTTAAKVPGGCVAVDVASSPEKFDLLTKLAGDFNKSKAAKAGGTCGFVRVAKVSSGAGEQQLADGWPDSETDVPKPVIWTPAAGAWGAVLNDALQSKGQAAMAPTDAKSLMRTPLTIAMPRPMAQALGWPNTPIGFSDLLKLATDPNGWASKGHPEWGPFRLGKTNPHLSTSALTETIGQYYAATGKTSGLTLEDVNNPTVDQFNRNVESAVVHYGDTTLTFLNNLYRADSRGLGLSYVSAVAVEEKSVIDYNTGNPDGILDPGEKPRPPKIPLAAIYPKEGTLFSDSPLFVLNAPWVTAKQRTAAQAFISFVLQPESQRQALTFGFRPGNPQVAVAAPIDAGHGVDPNQPQTTLGVPEPNVLGKLIAKWDEQRKGARVLLVMDVSGSMGDQAVKGGNDTKLELAQQAAVSALGQFKADDQVGLRIFSTNVSRREPTDYTDVIAIGPIAAQRERMTSAIRNLIPMSGTPLYTTAAASYDAIKASFDPARINAVVLLTDGRNDDPRNDDLDGLLRKLRSDNEGQSATPVRLFTIGYGSDADMGTLQQIAQATNAAAYDARDPRTIQNVFTNVVSNF